MLKNLLKLLILFTSISIQVNAADIYRTKSKSGNAYNINIDGAIQKGDVEKFISLIFAEPIGVYSTVGLNSNGGDVAEAIKLASLIEQLRLRTMVKPNGICASACFFIWATGTPRHASSNPSSSYLGLVGLHRPYLRNPENTTKSLDFQSDLQKKISYFLSNNLIPTRLVDLMMARPSNDIYWLTRHDIEEIGDFSAPIEELFINKCKYNRRDIDTELALERQNRYVELSEFKKHTDAVENCIAELQYDMRFDGLKTFVAKYEKSYKKSANIAAPAGDDPEAAIVERVHPNWTSLVKSQKFKTWFDTQTVETQKLSESTKAVDAIKMIDKFKLDTRGKK